MAFSKSFDTMILRNATGFSLEKGSRKVYNYSTKQKSQRGFLFSSSCLAAKIIFVCGRERLYGLLSIPYWSGECKFGLLKYSRGREVPELTEDPRR